MSLLDQKFSYDHIKSKWLNQELKVLSKLLSGDFSSIASCCAHRSCLFLLL